MNRVSKVEKNIGFTNDLSQKYTQQSKEEDKKIISTINKIVSPISISLALAYYEVGYKMIDEFFESYEKEFLEYMIEIQKTDISVDKMKWIDKLPTERITPTRKMYLIMSKMYELSTSDENDELFDDISQFIGKLMKKSYNSTFRFYKNNSVLDYQEYSDYIRKRIKDESHGNLCNHLVFIWLYRMCFDDLNREKTLAISLHHIEIIYLRYLAAIESELGEEDFKIEMSGIVQKYYDSYIKKRKVPMVFQNLKDEVLSNSEIRTNRGRESMFDVAKALTHSELTKSFGAMIGWMRTHGVEPEYIIHDSDLDEKKMEIMAKYLSSDIETETEVRLLFPVIILLDSLIEEFVKTKKLYLENDSLKIKRDNFEKKMKYEETIVSKNREIENLKKEIELLKTNNKQLEKENKILNKENKNLSISLEEKVKDIENLENMIFTKEKQIEHSMNHTSEDLKSKQFEITPELIKELNVKKGVIIGGDYSLHHKLKEFLSEFNFVAPEDLNQFDLKSLKQLDTIYIYTNYLSHALYKKVIPYARKNNKRVIYLAGLNVEMIIEKIIE